MRWILRQRPSVGIKCQFIRGTRFGAPLSDIPKVCIVSARPTGFAGRRNASSSLSQGFNAQEPDVNLVPTREILARRSGLELGGTSERVDFRSQLVNRFQLAKIWSTNLRRLHL